MVGRLFANQDRSFIRRERNTPQMFSGNRLDNLSAAPVPDRNCQISIRIIRYETACGRNAHRIEATIVLVSGDLGTSGQVEDSDFDWARLAIRRPGVVEKQKL